MLRRVCVYCGSSQRVARDHHAAAEALGGLLARRGLELVFGGGHVGLMGTVADAALAAGGRVWGVIPRPLMDRELGHAGCTELLVVDGMHARKTVMAQLADAFIALPGGLGTMEELFEMLTWRQLGFHDKPVGLLDVGGYYGPLVAWLDRARAEGFLRPEDHALLQVDTDPARLLDRLAGGAP